MILNLIGNFSLLQAPRYKSRHYLYSNTIIIDNMWPDLGKCAVHINFAHAHLEIYSIKNRECYIDLSICYS